MSKKQTIKRAALLISFGFCLSISLFFVDEGKYSFGFLGDLSEIKLLLFFAFVFSVLPLAIYGFMSDRTKSNRAFTFSFAGFLPPVVVLLWLVLA